MAKNSKPAKPTKPAPTKPKAKPAAGKSEPAGKSAAAGKSAPAGAPRGADPKVVLKVVSENRKARFEYEILEAVDCGIALQGSEVKSLRNGKLSLDEAYARVESGEVYLLGADIAEYPQATLWNHKPKRPRKLLLHREQIRKFAMRAKEKGLTLVPLKVYLSERGVFKVTLGLCKGKKLHDKRETLKKNDAKREMDRASRRRT